MLTIRGPALGWEATPEPLCKLAMPGPFVYSALAGHAPGRCETWNLDLRQSAGAPRLIVGPFLPALLELLGQSRRQIYRWSTNMPRYSQAVSGRESNPLSNLQSLSNSSRKPKRPGSTISF